VASLADLPTGDHDEPDDAVRFDEQVRVGAKLADRYRLDRRVRPLPPSGDGVGGPQTWIGFDELLNRKVGLYLIAADHPRAEALATAARQAATVADARFVQVLDAVEEPGLVYVINEWISDAASLGSRLADGPLSPYAATKMARELCEAMTQAHDCGMPHGALDPDVVLVSGTGQIKILGLRLESALAETKPDADEARAADVRAIGRLWYAALTARWPGEAAHGLAAAPAPGKAYAPAQVRAAIPKPVDQLVAQILTEDEPSELTDTKSLTAAISRLPRMRDESEPDLPAPGISVRPADAAPAMTATRSLGLPVGDAAAAARPVPRSLIAAVVGVVVVLGIVLALEFTGRQHPAAAAGPSSSASPDLRGVTGPPEPFVASAITAVHVWDSDQGTDGLTQAPQAYDGVAAGWSTSVYKDGPSIAPFRPGTGLIFDLGAFKNVQSVQFVVPVAGANVEVWTAATAVTAFPTIADSAPPGFTKQRVLTGVGGPQAIVVTFPKTVTTRFVMIWFTALPYQQASEFKGAGYRDSLADVKIIAS
jgi:hypothetical protein